MLNRRSRELPCLCISESGVDDVIFATESQGSAEHFSTHFDQNFLFLQPYLPSSNLQHPTSQPQLIMTAPVEQQRQDTLQVIQGLDKEASSLNLQDLPTQTTEPAAAVLDPSRSHDPEVNKKQSDPFAFGNRHLKEDDDVYEFNAWDNVEPDDDHLAFTEVQFAKQRESPVSDFDKRTLVFYIFLLLYMMI